MAAGTFWKQRFSGQRARNAYREAAVDAAGDTQESPAWRGQMSPFSQRARDATLTGARQQTVQHWQIREQMQQNEDRAKALEDERIRDWARLALSGQKLNLDAANDRARLLGDERDRLLRARDQWSRQDLAERGFQRQGEEDRYRRHMGDEEMQLNRDRFEADAELKQRELEQRKSRENERRLRPSSIPDVYLGEAKKLGVDTSGFKGVDEEGREVWTGAGDRFLQMLDAMNDTGDYRGAGRAELTRGAAREMGLLPDRNRDYVDPRTGEWGRGEQVPEGNLEFRGYQGRPEWYDSGGRPVRREGPSRGGLGRYAAANGDSYDLPTLEGSPDELRTEIARRNSGGRLETGPAPEKEREQMAQGPDARGGWRRVQLPDGTLGWAKGDEFVPDGGNV